MDRLERFADILVNYSTKVEAGDVVQISADELAKPLVKAVYREVLKKEPAEVRVNVALEGLDKIFFDTASDKLLESFPDLAYHEAKNTDVYIAIRAPANTRRLSSVDPHKTAARAKTVQPIKEHIVENVRWVITEYPTNAQAQEADMSFQEYEDFVFEAVTGPDWEQVAREQEALVARFNEASEARIVAEDTDLTLSIKGRKTISAAGEHNMPDGEVFTSVVEDSTEGRISFSYPAIYQGREVTGVALEFEVGEVVSATATKGRELLNSVLDTDEGARRLGELGIGNNFKIDRFTKNILFDEKIGGSVHLALGSAYKKTGGKNEPAVHWDMIRDLREGGELYLDGELVQKDGVWSDSIVEGSKA